MNHAGIAAIGFALCAASPALAQESEPLPRFEALEQQTLALEQQRLDKLETQRQQELFRPVTPNSGVSQADKTLRALEIEREMDRVRLEGAQTRAQVQRERDLAEASLPNRRIAAHSSLVIRDPERYILPRAPTGQYYARLEGRFVLVDAASELVVRVLAPRLTDPTGDVPLGAPPPVQPPLPDRPPVGSRLTPDSH
jgi:Ni/Co efflux regulator RcnB